MTSHDIRPDGWSRSLLHLAAQWPLEAATFTWRGPQQQPDGSITQEDFEQEGVRCADCGCRVTEATPAHVAQHLVMNHGYRMDGSREEWTPNA